MKVVATTTTGFLVEATKNELSQLMGYQESYYRRDRWDREEDLKIGDELFPAKMYEKLHDLRDRADEVEKFRTALISIATLLKIPDVVANIKVGPDTPR